MKRILLSFGFMALFCLGTYAQENSDDNQIIIIQKTTTDDGSVTVKKKRFDKGESPDTYLEALQLENIDDKKMELTIVTDEDSENESKTILLIRSGGEGEEVIIKTKGDFDSEDFDFDFDFDKKSLHEKNHKTSKALVGIYPEKTEDGVLITSLVYGGGARAAGMKPGDVITSVDGAALTDGTTLSSVMRNYQPGDVISVNFLRGEQALNAQVTLTERGKTHKRNPCKIFIGVNLGTSDGAGIKISSTIDGWPAEEMALESGDRILAMDGVKVEDFNELLAERNKHEAGDPFVLTILRDGATFDVDGQFKSCPEEKIAEPTIIGEAPTEPQPQPEELPQVDENLELSIQGFNAYPNPTAGLLNIRFRGEPVPTVVTVVDINGQQLFQQVLNDFSGYYAEEVDLSKGTPGAITVTIRQGDNIQTKQIILLSRA